MNKTKTADILVELLAPPSFFITLSEVLEISNVYSFLLKGFHILFFPLQIVLAEHGFLFWVVVMFDPPQRELQVLQSDVAVLFQGGFSLCTQQNNNRFLKWSKTQKNLFVLTWHFTQNSFFAATLPVTPAAPSLPSAVQTGLPCLQPSGSSGRFTCELLIMQLFSHKNTSSVSVVTVNRPVSNRLLVLSRPLSLTPPPSLPFLHKRSTFFSVIGLVFIVAFFFLPVLKQHTSFSSTTLFVWSPQGFGITLFQRKLLVIRNTLLEELYEKMMFLFSWSSGSSTLGAFKVRLWSSF